MTASLRVVTSTPVEVVQQRQPPQDADPLVSMAVATLRESYNAQNRSFTLSSGDARRPHSPSGVAPLGLAAIGLLGVVQVPGRVQRHILHGDTASTLAAHLVTCTVESNCLQDLALVSWAAAEAGCGQLETALGRLVSTLRAKTEPTTLAAAWSLAALSAAWSWRHSAPAARYLRDLLVESTAAPAGRATADAGRLSTSEALHTIYALSVYSRRNDDPTARSAAELVARRLLATQGEYGEWPALRRGSLRQWRMAVRYDSVEHLALAPMAFRELARAGGPSEPAALRRALCWVTDNPQTGASLVDPERSVVCRSVEVRRAPARFITAGHRERVGSRSARIDVDPTWRIDDAGWLLYARRDGLGSEDARL